ncbi:unnamed protein product [Rhizophagus irregularis]|nr:unnamed protein product [Rhizophagus irregularis]
MKDKALDTPLCIVQNKIILLIYCPLKLFPGALCIYLWFAVARSNYSIEQNYFWYFSGVIWVTTICVNIVGFRENRKEKNWGVIPGEFFCKSTPSNTVWLFYLIPTTVYAFSSLLVSAHSSYILWGRWRNFNQKQNRRTAIDLGYAVRLTVLSGFYSILLLASLIPSVTEKIDNDMTANNQTITFLDFAPAFFYILWGRWRNFNQKQNRRTAIDLGYAVRLTVLSGFYSILLLASLIPSVTEKIDNDMTANNQTITFLDFAPAFFGTMLFMIFGTTKSAAIFLPCCYYIPPSERKRQRSMISQQYENSSIRSRINDSIELDVIIKQDSSGIKQEISGIESIFESNFATVSTRNTILED